MNHQNQENLKDLFERFASPREAEQAVDDVRQGEKILRQHPAPEPDKELLAEIKKQVRSALRHKKTATFPRLARRITAVAAVLVIGALITISLFEQGAAPIPPTTIVWKDPDPKLAAFSAEIEQIESDLLALQLGENGTNGHSELTELEMELIEIDSDFWKG